MGRGPAGMELPGLRHGESGFRHGCGIGAGARLARAEVLHNVTAWLPSPACGRGVGVRASVSTKSKPAVCQRLPSPPAPLPQAGEGSTPPAC
ncbi:hypothetical protein CBM2634_A10096 [Cupriavidus taiwanensis]|uniref:Uncharacterized protein n=1 Tax=Cupriavidus taiwanensis TaxID=164546 RepID=A0A375IX03_9BURK|nr:hypothetical protein CBM2634_A10096 [Cupriavidus taiwanensis]